jgi:hypothetical protein
MFKLGCTIFIQIGLPDGFTISQFAAEINAANALCEWKIAFRHGQCLNWREVYGSGYIKSGGRSSIEAND